MCNYRKKIDVLLTQPPHPQDENVPYLGREIPLGLAYLGAYLERENIRTAIVDMNIDNEPFPTFKKALHNLKPKFVGISAFTVDITCANRIAKFCKDLDKNIVTIVGGIHATALPRRTLEEFKYFDFLIHGQGELPLTELVNNLKSNKDIEGIKGLAYRNGNSVKVNPPRNSYIPLDGLPFPAREKLELSRYAPHSQKYMKLPNTGILSSTGCPYQCTYCCVHSVHPRLDMRKPENVIKEIEECNNKFGIYDFRFFDDCLTLNRARLINLCNLMIEKKLKIYWNCQSRVDTVDLALLKLMKKAGCHQITYGVEVGTEKALKIINKRATLEQAYRAIDMTKKAGIESGGSFMLGIPGETTSDIKQTIGFAKKLSPDIATFYILKAYPGTPIFEKKIKQQNPIHINWEDYLIQGPPVFDIGIAPQRLISLLKGAYRGFYFRPKYIWQRAKNFFKSPKREIRLVFKGAKMVTSYFRQ